VSTDDADLTTAADATTVPPADAGGEHGHDSWGRIVADAAIEAEFQTGKHEETVEEARRHVALRLLSIVGGFTLIALGLAALPLPGPGWLIIIVGLSLLPFQWADRTILIIRRRIPGVPESGSIPPRTWAVMGALVVVFSVASILWGDNLQDWMSQLWGDPDRLLA
jgi:hypothetical protein